MRATSPLAITVVLISLMAAPVGAQQPALAPPAQIKAPLETSKEMSKEWKEAKRTAMQVVFLIVENLEQNRPEENAPVQPWLKDVRTATNGITLEKDPDTWPPIDSDKLVTRNPNFWNAYYQVAPGDPGLLAMHAGLLLTGGEATRAAHLVVVAGQRPGIPKELRSALEVLLGHSQRVHNRSSRKGSSSTTPSNTNRPSRNTTKPSPSGPRMASLITSAA